jgi:hypothetical protein
MSAPCDHVLKALMMTNPWPQEVLRFKGDKGDGRRLNALNVELPDMRLPYPGRSEKKNLKKVENKTIEKLEEENLKKLEEENLKKLEEKNSKKLENNLRPSDEIAAGDDDEKLENKNLKMLDESSSETSSDGLGIMEPSGRWKASYFICPCIIDCLVLRL